MYFLCEGPPSRLKVLKNGEADQNRAVIVVGPDLTNVSSYIYIYIYIYDLYH